MMIQKIDSYIPLKYRQPLALLIIAFLSLLLLYTLVHTVLLFQSPRSLITSKTSTSNNAPVRTLRLSQWHVFGEAPVNQQTANNLPETSLPLNLEGIFKLSDIAHSHAIISGKDQEPQVYYQGDSLPNGAVIDKILDDRVIIKKEGHLESLTLPKSELAFESTPEGLNFTIH